MICQLFPMTSTLLVNWTLSLLFGVMILLFIFRIVLTWYPQVNVHQFPVSWVVGPTEPFLTWTQRWVPPVGGVDITPVIWVGVLSLVRELLLGQQGLLTLMVWK